ncbi:haloacid dehalogenase-like hydrolase [Candidatus Woesearchaeota archaeon]|nr:haloacid dehalogenase-like hydrolase [Candidatus Woesearchaeota archaeon]
MKLALLDIDKTVRPGYMSMEFLEYLNKKIVLPQGNYNTQMKLVGLLGQRSISYEQWCTGWGVTWADMLLGMKVDDYLSLAKDFFSEAKKTIYPAAYGIAELLRERNYKTVCLSVGDGVLGDLFIKEVGIEQAFGTFAKVENGIYTGKLATGIHLPGGKMEIAKGLIRSENWEETLGIGDSMADMEFIDLCSLRFAANPSKEMVRAIERKAYASVHLENLTKERAKIVFNYIP